MNNNVITFKTKMQLFTEWMTANSDKLQAHQEQHAQQNDTCNDFSGPAGNWNPTQAQLDYVQGYAESYYDDDVEEEFSVDVLVEMLDNQEDPVIGLLNDAQLKQMCNYGEVKNWANLAVADFIAYRMWHMNK